MSAPQLEMFAAAQTTAVLPLQPAPISDRVRALAEKLPSELRLGTMSWNYPGWIGRVYAQGTAERDLVRRGLGAYAQHPLFRAVELNRTQYEAIPADLYALFAAQTPDHFRFVAKAHQDCCAIFHGPNAGAKAGQRNPRLLDAQWTTDFVVQPFVEGLRAKAGALVFQFPPQPVRSPERFAEALHRFLERLPRGPLYAVELRNRELLTDRYGEALVATGAVHCHNAWGSMPSVLAQRDSVPEGARRVLVARWLTRPGETYQGPKSPYQPFDRLQEPDEPRREQLIELMTEQPHGFVMVNNETEGCAPESIEALAERFVERSRARTSAASNLPAARG
jgi:uncharacterized protein YecE (DUF72 family)